MEQALIQLLADTQCPTESIRRNAEAGIAQLRANDSSGFAEGLVAVAGHNAAPIEIRQSALLVLKEVVRFAWSPKSHQTQDGDDSDRESSMSDDFGHNSISIEANARAGSAVISPDDITPISEFSKRTIRVALLKIALANGQNPSPGISGLVDRKLQAAAALVIHRIAFTDLPHGWPELLPAILETLNQAAQKSFQNTLGTTANRDYFKADDEVLATPLLGALRILSDLIEDGFGDPNLFLGIAQDLISGLFQVANRGNIHASLRALSISVFRSCFDILAMALDEHKEAIRRFIQEALSVWMKLFSELLTTRIDTFSSKLTEEPWRGVMKLKLQTLKTIMKVRSHYPRLLTPYVQAVFAAVWDELFSLQKPYHDHFVLSDSSSRLEDSEGIPYSLDFLVLEELDLIQTLLRSQSIRLQLLQRLEAGPNSSAECSLMTRMMSLAETYSCLPTEEAALWEIDVNVYLTEETGMTANYTPRTACSDLVRRLAEWFPMAAVDGFAAYTRAAFDQAKFPDQLLSWKKTEAALFIVGQLLEEFHDEHRVLSFEAICAVLQFLRAFLLPGTLPRAADFHDRGSPFLRARCYLVAGSLVRAAGETLAQHHPSAATAFLEATIIALNSDTSDVVRVSCIRACSAYLTKPVVAIPDTRALQSGVFESINQFIRSGGINPIEDSGEDLLLTVLETLRDAIVLDPITCAGTSSPGGTGDALDLLLNLTSRGAVDYQVALLVGEAFEAIVLAASSDGLETFSRICARVLPQLIGVFEGASNPEKKHGEEEEALIRMAADLLDTLVSNGTAPLPTGFVETVMPTLTTILARSTDPELLKSATSAMKETLAHDCVQVFSWADPWSGKSGLEIVLLAIDRLLGPDVDDNSALEVGGLAAELVQRAGPERLGPYLMQLLRGVAIRLGFTEHAGALQNLIMVFARLAVVNASEIVEFLNMVEIGDRNGLQVVVPKWLENSASFAGYEDIKINITALTKLYLLRDPRLEQLSVKGDLIIEQSDRIMTRSQARKKPERHTLISAQLKILKVLVGELRSSEYSETHQANPRGASGGPSGDVNLGAFNEGMGGHLDADDDDEWEDDSEHFGLDPFRGAGPAGEAAAAGGIGIGKTTLATGPHGGSSSPDQPNARSDWTGSSTTTNAATTPTPASSTASIMTSAMSPTTTNTTTATTTTTTAATAASATTSPSTTTATITTTPTTATTNAATPNTHPTAIGPGSTFNDTIPSARLQDQRHRASLAGGSETDEFLVRFFQDLLKEGDELAKSVLGQFAAG